MVSWLIVEYTEDAPAMYVMQGDHRHLGPILLKDLLNIEHQVHSVLIRSVFFPPDQVKFPYSGSLWIKEHGTFLTLRASKHGTSNKPVLHGIGMTFPQPPTLQHQQSFLQWLMKSYTMDIRC